MSVCVEPGPALWTAISGRGTNGCSASSIRGVNGQSVDQCEQLCRNEPGCTYVNYWPDRSCDMFSECDFANTGFTGQVYSLGAVQPCGGELLPVFALHAARRLACLRDCLLACACPPPRPPARPPAHLLACLPACPPACPPARLPARLPACSCLPAWLPIFAGFDSFGFAVVFVGCTIILWVCLPRM
eukprot:SAG22_NODE_58_length_23645_cov_16.637943_2_plen_187_part_00